MNSVKSKAYLVKILVEFSAAHRIHGYDGDCARPHGHNFKVEVHATTPKLNEIGLALDFKDLKRMTKTLVDRFDHQDLNTIAPFDDINPTAETLAHYFFTELEKQVGADPKLSSTLSLKSVTVWENERSAASFGFVE